MPAHLVSDAYTLLHLRPHLEFEAAAVGANQTETVPRRTGATTRVVIEALVRAFSGSVVLFEAAHAREPLSELFLSYKEALQQAGWQVRSRGSVFLLINAGGAPRTPPLRLFGEARHDAAIDFTYRDHFRVDEGGKRAKDRRVIGPFGLIRTCQLVPLVSFRPDGPTPMNRWQAFDADMKLLMTLTEQGFEELRVRSKKRGYPFPIEVLR